MALDAIPLRKTGQRIKAEWINLYRSVLSDPLVPRNVNGIPDPRIGSLGRATLRFLGLYVNQLKFTLGEAVAGLKSSSTMPTDYTLTLPAQLPTPDPGLFRLSETGALDLVVPDSSIDTAKGSVMIKDQGILQERRDPAYGQIYSASSGNGSIATNGAEWWPLTNQSLTITTLGRPVWLMLTSTSASIEAYLEATQAITRLRFKRDGTVIAQYALWYSPGGSVPPVRVPPNIFKFLDSAASAGSHTYMVEVSNVDPILTGEGVFYQQIKLVAFEIQ
jgi:hypothetical protein